MHFVEFERSCVLVNYCFCHYATTVTMIKFHFIARLSRQCQLVAFVSSFVVFSNLTAPSARAFDLSKHLTRNDIKFSRNGAVLRICWSKTLQHREGILLIPLPLIPSSDLCPVTAIDHYFQLVPADVNSSFFCVPQGPLLQPITFSLFSSFLKETITAIGLDATNFSPHSFCRGGATHAYQSGVPDHLGRL